MAARLSVSILPLPIAAVLAACSGAPPAGSAAPADSFDAWAETFVQDWMREAPQFATRTQYFSGDEQDALDRRLSLLGEGGNPYGASTWARRAALARRGREELSRFTADSMPSVQRTSAALLQWALDDTIASAEFAEYPYVFDQFNGLQLDLVNHLTQGHPIRRRRDIENYLARLPQVAEVVDQGISEARSAVAAGILPPRFILQRTIEQLDGFLEDAPRNNPFVSTFDQRIGAMEEPIAQADRVAFVAAAEKVTSASVIPGYRRIRDFLAGQIPRATDEAGVWRLPRGDAFYRRALETFTTTSLTPDQIHEIGLREVARLEGEMDAILRQLGYANGTVNERYAQLEVALQPKGAADPRPEILADNEKWVRDAERRSAMLFDLRPKAPVEVRREPPLTEKTSAAHYSAPAPDGTQPGVFWLPLPGPPYTVLRRRSLSYHEAVPGHHFQVALQQEMPGLPKFRSRGAISAGSAFVEGWALYAERLADENGWYEGDLHGRLGYLNSMLFRARRLVVDTGIHAKRWTRQQAIDYGLTAQEVERYIVWPGQACAYMIGQLRIVELREKARAALGPRFSIREFHDLVLRTGDVPLDVLGREVDAWIASAR
jgi:uncharacterized protein (DUF885 family)